MKLVKRMQRMPSKPIRKRANRALATALGVVFILGAVISPFVAAVIQPIPTAHAADKLWESQTTPPGSFMPCGNGLTAGPGFGICTDAFQYEQTIGNIKDRWEFELMIAAFMGFFDMVTYVGQTIAYDTAEWIADGAKGGGPLWYKEPFGEYMGNVWGNAVGEFMMTFSEESVLADLGLNLCRPPNFPELSLEFMLSIPDIALPGIERPVPRCPWNQFKSNWKAAAASMSNVESLGNIRGQFTSGGNDLAFGIGAHVALFDALAEHREAGILERLEGGGFKPVTDYLTGNISTPSAVVQAELNQQLIVNPSEIERLGYGAILGNAFELGFIQLGKLMVSTFVNTLATKLLGKLMKGLFSPGGDAGFTLPDLLNPSAAPPGSTNREEIIASQFQDILTPKLTSVQEEDVLVELEGCPDVGRSKWNCAIDRSFAQALRQGGMTLRQAINLGFIDENWRLIPSTELKDNQDPTCAQRAFCVANLRKLRHARIVPIGWELAADSKTNQQACSRSGGCVTLGEVMNHFDDCNYDESQGGSPEGTLDSEHPWCHLIDPNWVLTIMPSQCLTQGYGSSLVQGSAQRIAECQDTVMCLERDAEGKCVGGYGYCLAEQTFWQFDALSCDEQYVSCRMFTPRGENAQPIGYLRSTLDYGACNETNVGCMWYATTRDASVTSTDAWTATHDGTVGKVYFDKTILPCDAAHDGCTELRRIEPGEPALNLLKNSSFEYVDGDSGALESWVVGAGSYEEDQNPVAYTKPEPVNGDASFDGVQAYQPKSVPSTHQIVRLKPRRQYTVSFYARNYTGTPRRAGVTIHFYRERPNDPNLPPRKDSGEYMLRDDTSFFQSSGCARDPYPSGGRAHQANVLIPESIGEEWERFECSFVTPEQTAWARVFVLRGDAGTWLVDAIKLEESEVATDYSEGLNEALSTVYMRVPPQELMCTGEANDYPRCDSYARVCRQNEAGCQGYTSLIQPTAPEVPAVLTPVDYCPEECVGYEEFRKQPSTFDYVRNPEEPELDDPDDDTIAAFIPSTSRVCSAQDVGCELFTNLEALEVGGESQAAYSYLRSCRKPGNDAQTYYTWEGSEETGYQLVTWSLVKDTDAPLPQGPKVLYKASSDGVLKDPASCNAVTYLLAYDPDCRQFYDPQGSVFYRYESQTILAHPDCVQLRKDRSSEADCTKTGGTFISGTNQCIYEAVEEYSKPCDAAVAGCRGYIGTQGNVQMDVFNEEFASEAYEATGEGANIALSLSEESVLVGDMSLRIQGEGDVLFETVPTEPGVLYELHFWGMYAGQGTRTVSINGSDFGTERIIGSVDLSSEWNVFRVGPFYGDSWSNATTTVLRFSGFEGLSFIDKVRVTRVTDVAYVIKDSWNTPAVCDRTPEGIPQPQAMLGCQTYVNRKQEQVHVRQFTRLCRDTAIGCTAYVHTENTESPYRMTWEREGSGDPPRTEITEKRGDHYEYYIEERAKACPESLKGCRSFGKPQFTSDRLALDPEGPFKTVYLLDDATLYEEALCSEPELFCESYAYSTVDESGTAYFRAPGEHACEWREGVVVAYAGADGPVPADPNCDLAHAELYTNTTYDGWFRVGTDCPCYEDRLMRGTTFGMRYTGDPGYNAWLGADQELYPAESITPQNPGTCVDVELACDGTDCPDDLTPLYSEYFMDVHGNPCQNSSDCSLVESMPGADQTVTISGTCKGGTYQAWTGTCPEAQAECTEFRDVNNKSDPLHPLGRPYYVINDQRLDKESCNSKVDPGDGCVLFRDMSNPNLLYSSLATQDNYMTRGYMPVDPIDCELRSEHPSCSDPANPPGRCINVEAVCGGGPCPEGFVGAQNVKEVFETVKNKQCMTDDDCHVQIGRMGNAVYGTCQINDTNIVVKVKPDRSCSQWLACETGETVYDAAEGQFRSICSDLALCNSAGEPEGAGVPYCTSFVNREPGSTESILTRYEVIDTETYASRPVGFGAIDYSGFTMPDKFQLVDTKLKPVASLLTEDPSVRSKYKKDYRLGIAIDMGEYPDLVRDLDEASPEDSKYLDMLTNTPELQPFACLFEQTKAIGLMSESGGGLTSNSAAEGALCWLSFDQSRSAQLAGAGAPIVSDNLNVANLTMRFSQDRFPEMDQTLSRSFPNTQCKAAPEPTSPFGNEYVIEWDDSVRPPEPSRAYAGYGDANFCEYGEECSCTYKRVQYGGRTKYYEPLSTDVINAICVGGYRDGLPCVPGEGIEGSQQITVNVSGGEEEGEDGGATNVQVGGGLIEEDERCGEGGTCTPISDVTLVRGITGQCLEYDVSRTRAGDLKQNECLAWNPNPVMTGPGDPYHWHVTAGFQPPQSSGRYYCTSPVRDPRTQAFTPDAWWPRELPEEGFDWAGAIVAATILSPGMDVAAWSAAEEMAGEEFSPDEDSRGVRGLGPMPNSEGYYAGRIRALFYADWYASDGSCSNIWAFGGCTGNEGGASLDGHKADGTKAGERCEEIDDEDGQPFMYNRNIMRLVTTGQGTSRSYAEYAILFNPWHIAYGALGFQPADWETVFSYSLEDVIASFEFSVPRDKIGCAYSEEWGDVNVGDYNADKNDGWGDKDAQWHAAFQDKLQQGGGTLNRSTAKIVTEDGSDTGIPVKVDCQIGNSEDSIDLRGAEEGLCFIKTWELNFDAEGKMKFQAFSPDIGRNSLDHLSRRPVYGACDSSNHWFSIRAVFEDTNPSENALNAEDVAPDQLVGPFQFVGLWITACAPGNETKYIYMDMNMNSADVCRELAETISKDSHDVVAFTERNSSRSGYTMSNGFNWYTTNIPFGASLATGDAGEQPLFMTGVRQQDVNPLNPPTFTSPGQTYFSSGEYPKTNWGLLSNVFAKIYRIYGYNSRGVSRTDYACTSKESPQFGQWCPPVRDMEEPEDWDPEEEGYATGTSYGDYVSAQFCGFQGRCLRGGINADDIFSQKVCNVFSGVNRGLDCTADPDICHKAPMEERNGVLTPRYGQCALFDGYYPTQDDIDNNGKQEVDQRWEQLTSGRYRCQGQDCPDLDTGCTWDGDPESENVTGCTRAEAIKHGAFRCYGSVRDPDRVKETIDGVTTYASYCTRESDNSSECPVEITSGRCDKTGSDITTAGHYESSGGGRTWIDGQVVGTCEGYPWAQCLTDADCHFTARNYWPSGNVNQYFYWTTNRAPTNLGQHNRRLGRAYEFIGSSGWTYYVYPNGSYLNQDGEEYRRAHLEAFWPATPWNYQEEGSRIQDCSAEDNVCFFGTNISSLTNVVTYETWNDVDLLQLYPGFNPMVIWRSAGDWYGNHYKDDTNYIVPSRKTDPDEPDDPTKDLAPYVIYNEAGDYDNGKDKLWAHYGACESLALMWQEGGECGPENTCIAGNNQGQACRADSECMGAGSISGICQGGARSGEPCGQDSDCRPAGMSEEVFQERQAEAMRWCNPVTTGDTGELATSYVRSNADREPIQSGGPSADCWPAGADDTNLPNHPQKEPDPALDSNICTHPPGYWPRPNYCTDSSDEYCGLFGYEIQSRSESVTDEEPLPTDVTPGLYTPFELNETGRGTDVSENQIDYKYTDRYEPEPPQVAAPDIRTCEGGTCRITGLGTFAIDGLAGGIVNGGVGHHVATLRFYAWAAHEQMPMRKIYIDWGDGTLTELPDAHMKNRKPVCQTEKECTDTPGLTCETDADCPPGGGICVSWGTCSNDPNRTCYTDSWCQGTGGDDGFCEPRVYFGNDQDACEEQYFEFRHAYSCMPDNLPASCEITGDRLVRRCSGTQEACDTSSDCPPGDDCVDNIVPSSDFASETGGCYDGANNRCMYTPRIMVVDNWGWCTGECRAERDDVSGDLVDSNMSPILHPNGGCFDASNIKSNVDFSSIIGPNECGLESEERIFSDDDMLRSSRRPWVVFPGALQLLPGEEL